MLSPDIHESIANLSPETWQALDTVADYLHLQAVPALPPESDRDVLAEEIAAVRSSLSLRLFCEGLAPNVRQELANLRLPDSSPNEVDLEAVVLTVSTHIALVRWQIAARGNVLETEPPALPDCERLRHGDLVAIAATDDAEISTGEFWRYTDLRIGHAARQALVWIDGLQADLLRVSPEQLSFIPEPEGLERRDELRRLTGNGFELRLFDTGQTDRHGKTLLAYDLYDDRFARVYRPIFSGADFAASPLHAIDSDATAAALLSFLALQPGDVEDEYFADYEPRQRQWRDERAESLSAWSRHLEERHQWRQWHEAGRTHEAVRAVIDHGVLGDLFEVLSCDVFHAQDVVDELELDVEDGHVRRFLQELHRFQMEELHGDGINRP